MDSDDESNSSRKSPHIDPPPKDDVENPSPRSSQPEETPKDDDKDDTSAVMTEASALVVMAGDRQTRATNPRQHVLSDSLPPLAATAVLPSHKKLAPPRPSNVARAPSPSTNKTAPKLDATLVATSVQAAISASRAKKTPMCNSSTPSRPKKRKRAMPKTPQSSGQSTGRWTPKEHQAFLEGLKIHGREWKKVADRIPTRTSAQIRSHAQKYFAKLQRESNTVVLDNPATSARVEQILANPSEAERQVEQTLQALRQRYRQLQQQLEATTTARTPLQRPIVPDDEPEEKEEEDHSCASSREFANEELIALHVLGGALKEGDSSSSSVDSKHSEPPAPPPPAAK